MQTATTAYLPPAAHTHTHTLMQKFIVKFIKEIVGRCRAAARPYIRVHFSVSFLSMRVFTRMMYMCLIKCDARRYTEVNGCWCRFHRTEETLFVSNFRSCVATTHTHSHTRTYTTVVYGFVVCCYRRCCSLFSSLSPPPLRSPCIRPIRSV